ncbi:DUF456 domain-containing protein [Tenacibaculum aestuariivivum]|uniref:DUF456 domain-containing protein n=1 Tax=Tenacibaculum aestuariivivum TaxID=2006131 RepID=UPI003AB36D73
MDILLALLDFIFISLGILGSFLPIFSGPITSWVGLLLLYLTRVIPQDWTFLGITLVVAVFIFFINYLIHALETKRFGGTKYGVYVTTIGLIIGLLSPIPFGIIIGAFTGALIGELIYDSKNTNRALKASFGALLGFLTSVTIKFSIAIVYFVLFMITF